MFRSCPLQEEKKSVLDIHVIENNIEHSDGEDENPISVVYVHGSNTDSSKGEESLPNEKTDGDKAEDKEDDDPAHPKAGVITCGQLNAGNEGSNGDSAETKVTERSPGNVGELEPAETDPGETVRAAGQTGNDEDVEHNTTTAEHNIHDENCANEGNRLTPFFRMTTRVVYGKNREGPEMKDG